MSNRANVEALNAELAGVQCQVEQLAEVMRRRSIGDCVSRSDFEVLVDSVTKMADMLESLTGMVEGISETVGEIEAEVIEHA